MPLPTFPTLAEVPEGFREAYHEVGGKAVPKVHTDADVAGLRANAETLLNEKKAAAARAALLGDRTPEQVQADFELAKETREKKAKAEGDFEGLKNQMVEQHKAELGKMEERIKFLEGSLFERVGKSELTTEIVAAGGNPKALLPIMLPYVKPVEKDNLFGVEVVDEKGKPQIGDAQGTPMSLKQLVETFKGDKDYAALFAAPGGGGSGARNGGGGGDGSGTVIIPRGLPPAEYQRQKAAAEKAGRPYKLADK